MKRLLLMVIAVLVLAACGGSNDEDAAESDGESNLDDLFVTIATGGTSGVYYPLGASIGTILEDELGVETSVQATQASVENVNLVLNGQAELALITGDTADQAYNGVGPFEDEGAQEDLKAIGSLYPNFLHVATTEKSGIETFEDLKGKTVSVGAPNSGTELAAQVLFEGHGMTYDDIKPDYLSFGESVDQMKDGQIDAAILSSGIPNSGLMDLDTTADIKLIPIEGDALEKLTGDYPYLIESVIPADSYSVEEDITTLEITNAMIVNQDLSEDEVYQITKTFFENLDILSETHDVVNDIDIEKATEGLSVPLHPGAEKYYKEEGALE